MGYRLGVDLGTTWTAAAVEEGGVSEPLTLGSHGWAIPSIVVVGGDEVLAGEAAARRAASEPTSAAREFKRRLGDPTPFVLGGAPYGAEALTGHLLAHVVGVATERQGTAPQSVALSHPAAWGEFKLDQLKEAANLAGVGGAELLPEPAAAAIEYVRAGRVEAGSVVAVYDFGGGTFDAAVVRAHAERPELLGPAEGLERLGGVDFDTAVLAHVYDAVGGALDNLDRDEPDVRRALARLREECIAAKEALSSDTEASIPVDVPGLRTEVRLTRGELEAMARPRLDDTIAALRRALAGAEVEPEAVSAIVLVGGTSRMPVVGQVVAEVLGRPVLTDIDPKLVVARGAATLGTAVPVGEAAAAADGSAGAEAVPEGDTGARFVGVVSAQPGRTAAKDDRPNKQPDPSAARSSGATGRRVVAGAAVAGATVLGTAGAATAWASGDDTDGTVGDEAVAAEDAAPAPAGPGTPPAPPGASPAAAGAPPAAGESLDAMDFAAPTSGRSPRSPAPSGGHRAASSTGSPAYETTGIHTPESHQSGGAAVQEKAPSAADRLDDYKEQMRDRVDKWTPPKNAEAEDIAKYRHDTADLIDRFQLKPGESVEEGVAALQNELRVATKGFIDSERLEDTQAAVGRMQQSEQAKVEDQKEDNAEYLATRNELVAAVRDLDPRIIQVLPYEDKAALDQIKAQAIARIQGAAFNAHEPGGVIAQQTELVEDTTNTVRTFLIQRAQARLGKLGDDIRLAQDNVNDLRQRQDDALKRGDRKGAEALQGQLDDAVHDQKTLTAGVGLAQAAIQGQLKALTTDEGVYGKTAADKVHGTISNDADDIADLNWSQRDADLATSLNAATARSANAALPQADRDAAAAEAQNLNKVRNAEREAHDRTVEALRNPPPPPPATHATSTPAPASANPASEREPSNRPADAFDEVAPAGGASAPRPAASARAYAAAPTSPIEDPVAPVMPTLIRESPDGDDAGIAPASPMTTVGATTTGAESRSAAVDDDVTGEMGARATISGTDPDADLRGMPGSDAFEAADSPDRPDASGSAPDGTDGWLPTEDHDVDGAVRSGLNMEPDSVTPDPELDLDDDPSDPQDDPLGL